MDDKLNITEFENSLQLILNNFSDNLDFILFKYDLMKLIEDKIQYTNCDIFNFEKNIDKDCRLKHNENEIFDAKYIVDLINMANISNLCLNDFLHSIEEKAKTKKSYNIGLNSKKTKLGL